MSLSLCIPGRSITGVYPCNRIPLPVPSPSRAEIRQRFRFCVNLRILTADTWSLCWFLCVRDWIKLLLTARAIAVGTWEQHRSWEIRFFFFFLVFTNSQCSVMVKHWIHLSDHSFTAFSGLNSLLLLLLQNILLQQENTELRNNLVSAQEKATIVQQAIRDRDEAIAKWGSAKFAFCLERQRMKLAFSKSQF